MKPIVLGFAGSIASGKSTLSSKVAEALHWPRVSFGDYVRSVARLRGFPELREVLQAVGAELVEDDIEQFCRAVLAQVNWQPGQPLVIDGIRHVAVLTALRQLVAPMELYLIFIVVDESVRAVRLLERGKSNPTSYQLLELNSTEQQVKGYLENMADLVVDSTCSIEEATKEVTSWLQSQCAKN